MYKETRVYNLQNDVLTAYTAVIFFKVFLKIAVPSQNITLKIVIVLLIDNL